MNAEQRIQRLQLEIAALTYLLARGFDASAVNVATNPGDATEVQFFCATRADAGRIWWTFGTPEPLYLLRGEGAGCWFLQDRTASLGSKYRAQTRHIGEVAVARYVEQPDTVTIHWLATMDGQRYAISVTIPDTALPQIVVPTHSALVPRVLFPDDTQSEDARAHFILALFGGPPANYAHPGAAK